MQTREAIQQEEAESIIKDLKLLIQRFKKWKNSYWRIYWREEALNCKYYLTAIIFS